MYHGPVRVTRAGAAARTQICPEIPARPLTKKTACAILHTLLLRGPVAEPPLPREPPDGERGRGALREYASEQPPEPDKPQ